MLNLLLDHIGNVQKMDCRECSILNLVMKALQSINELEILLNCPNGILGLGGEASKNKLKDASFIFSMANVTILSIFRTRAEKEYRKVSKRKGTHILNILALLLFENLQRIYKNSRLNGTQSKVVK